MHKRDTTQIIGRFDRGTCAHPSAPDVMPANLEKFRQIRSRRRQLQQWIVARQLIDRDVTG